MAPHTTKKTTTTAPQSTSRSADHHHRKRVVELVDEHVDEEVVSIDEEGIEAMDVDEADALESSQHAHSGELHKLVANMVDDQRKRHHFRKQSVHTAYANTHAETQESITSLFDEHEAEAFEAHNAQLHRLEDLIKKKGEIEKAMATKVAALRASYNVNSDSLRKVIERRLGELH